jgi:hypothetical protein
MSLRLVNAPSAAAKKGTPENATHLPLQTFC